MHIHIYTCYPYPFSYSYSYPYPCRLLTASSMYPIPTSGTSGASIPPMITRTASSTAWSTSTTASAPWSLKRAERVITGCSRRWTCIGLRWVELSYTIHHIPCAIHHTPCNIHHIGIRDVSPEHFLHRAIKEEAAQACRFGVHERLVLCMVHGACKCLYEFVGCTVYPDTY